MPKEPNFKIDFTALCLENHFDENDNLIIHRLSYFPFVEVVIDDSQKLGWNIEKKPVLKGNIDFSGEFQTTITMSMNTFKKDIVKIYEYAKEQGFGECCIRYNENLPRDKIKVDNLEYDRLMFEHIEVLRETRDYCRLIQDAPVDFEKEKFRWLMIDDKRTIPIELDKYHNFDEYAIMINKNGSTDVTPFNSIKVNDFMRNCWVCNELTAPWTKKGKSGNPLIFKRKSDHDDGNHKINHLASIVAEELIFDDACIVTYDDHKNVCGLRHYQSDSKDYGEYGKEVKNAQISLGYYAEASKLHASKIEANYQKRCEENPDFIKKDDERQITFNLFNR